MLWNTLSNQRLYFSVACHTLFQNLLRISIFASSENTQGFASTHGCFAPDFDNLGIESLIVDSK